MMRKIKSRSASGPPRFFVCVPCPARRAQGVIIEGIKPSGKTQTFPPPHPAASGFPRFPVRCGINRHLSVFSPSFHDVPLVPSGRGKGACYGGVAPLRGPFPNPRITPPLPRAEALCSLPACSNKSFAFGTGGRTHPSPHGGRHEVRTRGLPFVRPPSRRRRDCRGAGTT